MVRLIVTGVLLTVAWTTVASGQQGVAEVSAETFSIDHFSYNKAQGKFHFRGKSQRLPEGTKLMVALSLNGEVGAETAAYLGEGRFEGEFVTDGRDVLPGPYALEVLARRRDQRGDARSNFPRDLANEDGVDRGVEVHEIDAASVSLAWARSRRKIVSQMREIREVYDECAQTGMQVIASLSARADGGAAMGSQEKTSMLQPWLTFYRNTSASEDVEMPGESELEQELEAYRAEIDGIFLSPYDSAVQKVIQLFSLVDQLRSAYTKEILEGLGMSDQISYRDQDLGRFPATTIIPRINALAWSIQNALGDSVVVWIPSIRIDTERGRWDGDRYSSQTSGFRIVRPSEGWSAHTGEEDSTLRLALNLGGEEGQPVLVTVQVHMVEFPWAETKEERARAWERLAEYEWENYRKLEGRFQTDENGQEFYLFRFHTRSEAVDATIACHLYFPESRDRKHQVYGLMEVSFYGGVVRHHFEEDLATILDSFQMTD